MNELQTLGWSEFFAAQVSEEEKKSAVPARVSAEHRTEYVVWTAESELRAELTGRFRHAVPQDVWPAAGDWVLVQPRGEAKAAVLRVLERRSAFMRKAAGPGLPAEQVVAANVDYVFLACALNRDFNLRRLERYLALAWESRAEPVVVLTKADLCGNLAEVRAAVENIAGGAPIHAVSALRGDGLDDLLPYLQPGRTAALLGSSGVGKSTLANRLAGQALLAVKTIGDDDTGRHTTTHRQLVRLPSGGLLLDTPGMRELQLWDAEQGVERGFDDVETLARQCRFTDCRHKAEPGCAILEALANGTLDESRLRSYGKLQREAAFQARRNNHRLASREKARWKSIQKNNQANERLKWG